MGSQLINSDITWGSSEHGFAGCLTWAIVLVGKLQADLNHCAQGRRRAHAASSIDFETPYSARLCFLCSPVHLVCSGLASVLCCGQGCEKRRSHSTTTTYTSSQPVEAFQ